MKALTTRQQEVYDLIRDHISQTGMPPTRAEIAMRLGFRSPNAAEEHLKALARKGVIEIVSGASPRGIRLLMEEEEGLPPDWPRCAGERCWRSSTSKGTTSGSFPVKPSARFPARVNGMSMRDIGILTAAICWRCTNARRAQRPVVVARIEDEVTVKAPEKHGNVVELLPENNEFQPIVVDLRQQNFTIERVGGRRASTAATDLIVAPVAPSVPPLVSIAPVLGRFCF